MNTTSISKVFIFVPVIDSSRDNEQVSLFDQNSDPLVILVPNIEIAAPVKTSSRFWVIVNVLFQKHLNLFLVIGKSSWGDGDFILKVVVLIFDDFRQIRARTLVSSVEFEKLASKC